MKVEVNEQSGIVLKEVYNAVTLETPSKQIIICMRDEGFEIVFNNILYEAKENTIEKIGCKKPCGMNYCDENGCVERKRVMVNDIPSLPTSNIK